MNGGLLAHFAGSELARAALRLLPYTRLLYWKAHRRSQRIRVSFSSLLRVRADNQYILIRSRHRPDSFGPIGGVIKFGRASTAIFDLYEFEPQFQGAQERSNVLYDLRGVVPAKYLMNLVKWFERGRDRETGAEALSREIREEMAEISADFVPPRLGSTDVRLVRTVYEGPQPVPGRDYWQFRIFEIYELADNKETHVLSDQLQRLARSSDHVILATTDEINSGRLRASLVAIGHHAEYLLRPKSGRRDLPPMYP